MSSSSKFIISSGAWLKALTKIAGALANNPVVPILETIQVVVRDGLATLTASDLQTTLTSSLPIEAEMGADFAICIPGKMLLDTLKALPDQPVTVTVGEDHAVVIKSINGRFKIAGENAGDYPRLPELDGPCTKVRLTTQELRAGLAATLATVSRDELRPAMCGVLLDMSKDEQVKFVSTDGHRLSMLTLPTPEEKWALTKQAIIPSGAGRLLASLVANVAGAVELQLFASRAVVVVEGSMWSAQLVDARYPDYEDVIPISNPNHMVMNRAELVASLRRVERFANRTTHTVKLKVASAELEVSGEDLDFSNSASERFTVQYDGDAIEIGFNATLLLGSLALLQGEEVLVEMSTPNRAALLSDGDGGKRGQLLALVMPVMLNNYV